MSEEWKDIDGYKGYMVSNLGNIISKEKVWVTGRGTCRHKYQSQMKKVERNGYLYVGFCLNGKSKSLLIHRLVAKAFIPNPQNFPVVNHINGIKGDNRVENLEWLTPGENQKHAFRIGLKKATDSSKPIYQFSLNGEFIREWKNFKEVTDSLGYDRSALIRVCKQRQKSSYGYTWKYKKDCTLTKVA